VLSIFFRSTVAVLSPALINDFGMTSAQLGDLSAAFFYAFALVQIPVGMALDRFGVRVTMCLLCAPSIGGLLLFAMGQTVDQLIIARILLGIGMSGNLMTVLMLLAAWYPVDRFAILSGTVVSIGAIGNLLAATPLTYLHLSIGWRNSFLVFTLIDAAVIAAFLIFALEGPHGFRPAAVRPRNLVKNLVGLLRMYSYWAISMASFVRYGYLAALQSLWAAPFLIYGLGMGEIAASNAIFIMGVGYMIGLPISGSLSDLVFRSRKKVVLWSLAGFALMALMPLSWSQSVGLWLVFATFFAMGLAAAPGQILYAHMKELIPESMMAQAMTAVNLFTMLGAGVMTNLLGLFLGSEPSQLLGTDGFRPLWYVGAASLAIVLGLYSFVPDSRVLRRSR